MVMGDTESCSSRAVDFVPSHSRKQRQKVEVYNEVLGRLRELNSEEASLPGFEDELWAHFHRLPTRYALEVNAERAQDVLMHKKLLYMAHDHVTRPAIEVRLVQVLSAFDRNYGNSVYPKSLIKEDAQCSDNPGKKSTHPPPAFGSSPDLKFVYVAKTLDLTNKDVSSNGNALESRLMHEITISTTDKPKLLSQLTSLISEIGLNIQEAHAFSTTDGYSLDVFVVDGWILDETEHLRDILIKEILETEKHSRSKCDTINSVGEQEQAGTKLVSGHTNIPADMIDDWEIDPSLLKYEYKIASGSNGDLYKGSFLGQDVAIKVLEAEHLKENMLGEFAQEVYIMRKVQHKNIVQFIGACTRPPSLCIVTEFMSGGSMYNLLLKQKEGLKFASLLRVAIDVSRGMNYLHQKKIIHRDLKAANLLVDGDGAVKVADFGVARVQFQSGIMTAETGTYRWMAPEVIEHKPYDQKADVFSFGVVLWELLTGKLPYGHLTPIQAAVGVVQKGLRPPIPSNTHPEFAQLLEWCWQQEPSLRPEFPEIVEILQQLQRGLQRQEKTTRKKALDMRQPLS